MKKVGVLITDNHVYSWEAFIIKTLHDEGVCSFHAICDGNPAPSSLQRFLRNPRRTIPYLLDRLEYNYARHLLTRHPQLFSLDRRIPISELPFDSRLQLAPIVSRSGLVQHLQYSDIERLKSLQFDILFRFGFRILKGDILNVARHGIWSYHHADNRVNRGRPPGFWECYSKARYTGAIVQRLTEDLDNGQVLKRAWYRTYIYSWTINRLCVYEQAKFLMVDLVRALDTDEIIPNESDQCNIYSGSIFRNPSMLESVIALCKISCRIVAIMIRSLVFSEQWQIRTRDDSDPMNLSPRKFIAHVPPKGRYWADPFAITNNGERWLFVEEYEFLSKKGHIAALRLEGRQIAERKVAIATNYHMSYPFLFRFRNELYMVPETHSAGTVELWMCEKFPDLWVKVKNIFENISAADTTMLQYNGLWWMFTNVARSQAYADHTSELWIYYTEDPIDGEWCSHQRNPVVTDCRRARMGGSFIIYEGALYRVGQNNTFTYGYSTVVMRVETLTKTRYAEGLCGEMRPDWGGPGLIAAHHLSIDGDFAAIDVLRWRCRVL